MTKQLNGNTRVVVSRDTTVFCKVSFSVSSRHLEVTEKGRVSAMFKSSFQNSIN